MATRDESMSEDSLWDASVTGKSWVELAEDDDEEFKMLNHSSSVSVLSPAINSCKVETETTIYINGDSATVRKKSIEVMSADPKLCPRNVASIITEEESCDTLDRGILNTISEESCDTKDSPPLKNVTQTYANILKNSPLAEAQTTIKSEPRPEVKKELGKEFLHEDISLTGHIEGFQLTSPCKSNRAPGFKTPTKVCDTNSSTVTASPRSLKRKLLLDSTGSKLPVPDEMLMPSPSKIPRPSEGRLGEVNSPRFSNSNSSNTKTRKRPREYNTPNRRPNRTPRELETNEEVLARRQKQIDYGKNTIGYERYRQLVPKEARKSIHPRTPPQHLKYSRRAWEGMVRIWRQRLHFWDPPSEGGGDPACLEADYADMSDVSSTDGSLPSTPVQDLKRRQVSSSPAGSVHRTDTAKSLAGRIDQSGADNTLATADYDDFDNQGCQPLSP